MERESAREFYRQLFAGSWITQGLWVAAELGVADLLAAEPRTAEELASAAGVGSDGLYRVMRALASVGVFAEDGAGRFGLTPLAEPLRSDGEGSRRAFTRMMGAEFHGAWGELLHTVRTGEPGFEERYGAPFFRYMTDRPERHGIYDAAMADVHGPETAPMIEAYDFGGFGTVMDVGGGNGSVLAAILQRHPTIRGILFDLPAVADRARSMISATGLGDRCRVVEGDFFASLPRGADVCILRHILHDWQDREAAAILRSCRRAMGSQGRVLVVEMVLRGTNEPGFAKWLDLMMLVVGGRERTEAEYGRLFSAAGFELSRVVPTTSEISLIEGVPARRGGRRSNDRALNGDAARQKTKEGAVAVAAR